MTAGVTPGRTPRRTRQRPAVAALLAAPLLAAGLAACQSRAAREQRLAAERDSVMLAAALRDSAAEADFRGDSAALAASLAVDTVAGAFLRTGAVAYYDAEDDAYRTAVDTVYTVVGRRLGFCEDVSAEVARGRAAGDTLTCQWVVLGDSVLANATPIGADRLPTPLGVIVAGGGTRTLTDTAPLTGGVIVPPPVRAP